jgi:hypothetical protein
MKSEQRHKLQTNKLADTLGHEIEYVKPYFKTILGIVIAVIAVGFTIAYLSSRQAAKNDVAWSKFFDVVASPGEEELDKYVETYGNTPAGLWASLAAADMKLNRGSFEMYRDRKEAEVQLDQAKKQFLSVIDAAKNDRMVLRRAQLGLAETYETLNSPEEAEPIYEKLVKDSPDDVVGAAAKERLRQMRELVDQKWFAWYEKHTPPAPFDPNSMGRDPFDLNNLPGQDNLRNKNLPPAPGSLIEGELDDLSKEQPLFPGFTPGETKGEEMPPDATTPKEPVTPPAETPAPPETPAPAEPSDDQPQPEPAPPAAPAPMDSNTDENPPAAPTVEPPTAEPPAAPAPETPPATDDAEKSSEAAPQ